MIIGIRLGVNVLVVWVMIKYFGFDGYKEVVKEKMEFVRWFVLELKKILGIYFIRELVLNIVLFGLEKLEEFEKEFKVRGWGVSVYRGL